MLDLPSCCAPGVHLSSEYVETAPGVQLYVARIRPALESRHPPVVLLPGLASIPHNFRGTLLEMTRHTEVLWLETREKSSSRIQDVKDVSIPAMAQDLRVFVEKAGLPDDGYVLMGYSLSASVILEASRSLPRRPRLVALAEPNATFDFPPWALLLARYAVPLYRPLLPFLKWYMRTFVIRVADDREMYAIYCNILDAADPRKIAAVVRAVKPWSAWAGLDDIDLPVLVLGTSKDRLHRYEDTLRIAASLRHSTFIDMETNDRTHSGEVVGVVLEASAGPLARLDPSGRARVRSPPVWP
ncbi:MAG: alpha/beta hydrolase [Deltaproteobacteria bacterium]|nr:alpha/beta hydrolase [Deltaproteobacteria bacterium]